MGIRSLPSVDRFLGWAQEDGLLEIYPRTMILNYIREIIQQKRNFLKSNMGVSTSFQPDEQQIKEEVSLASAHYLKELRNRLETFSRTSLQRVINGTGVVIHTNLGRSILAEEALSRISEIGRCYSNLEIDLLTGQRGSRLKYISELLINLTKSEAALVVNNNAAAVMLALESLAKGKEVIVSRGELVEIGGSFRLPAIMEKSGAILREVGTTNKTSLQDYEEAITERTGLLLKVHPSNFAIIGFTAKVELADLVELGRKHAIVVMEDLGSGDLLDLSTEGFGKDLTIVEAVKSGVDLLTFSGDKLLGGPQAGIILGKGRYIDQLKNNPLYRALRVDKLILAGLEATIELYFNREKAKEKIPTLRLLCMNQKVVEKRARRLLRMIRRRLPASGLEVSLEKEYSEVGGGAYPSQTIPSSVLVIRFPSLSVSDLEERLRLSSPSILGRIRKDSFTLDVRTLLDRDFQDIIEALLGISDSLTRSEA